MSEKWEKLTPLDGRLNPCLCCPPIPAKAPMGKLVAVGFGGATASCDGQGVADGEHPMFFPPFSGSDQIREVNDYITFGDIEAIAKVDPDHDWRIDLFGPMHGETYQRQGDGLWVLVEKHDGFA